MEGQKSTAAQCSFAFVEWYLGELYQQWKQGKETIVRPKNCYYTFFLFSWFVVGVFFCLFRFFSFEKVLSECTSHPWFGLQPSLQAPYKSDLAAHCSPAPSSRASDLGTLSGERPKTGWPHARASKPLLPTIDEWGALVTSLADCALCILGFNVESKTGPIRGFTLPDKRGKKIKLKRKKVFGVRKMTLATPAFSSFAG